jgi:hypothetical protein
VVATKAIRDLSETYTRTSKLISHYPKMPKGPAAAFRQKLKDDRSKRFREAQIREHGAARASQAALARRAAGAAYGTATGALDRMARGVAAAEASPRLRRFRETAGRVGSQAVGAAAKATGSALGYVARKTAGAAGSALGYVARKAASAGADLGARALSGAYRGIRAIPTVAQDAMYAARRMANEANVRRLEQQVAAMAARVAQGPLAAADS